MTKIVLVNIQFTSTIKDVLSILTNKTMINFIVKILPKGEFIVKIVFFLNDDTFSFTYNIKTTISSQFINLKLFYIDNFQTNINMVVEI